MTTKKPNLMLVFDPARKTISKQADFSGDPSPPPIDLEAKRINKVVIEEGMSGGFSIRVSYTKGVKSDLLVVETSEDMHAAVGLLFRRKPQP